MRIVLLIALSAGMGSGQTPGTWKMNPAKSTYDKGPFPRSLAMRFEPHPEGEAVTIWRVTGDGTPETDSYILHYDGKDHPYPRPERFDSFNARKLDGGAIAVLYKKDGKVVSRHVRRLSAGGKQLTLEVRLISRDGSRLERFLVFERQ